MKFPTLLPALIKPHTHTHYPGIGQAENCQVDTPHNPPPLRFVWHHICPQACGGKTQADNLAALCDTDHYAIHYLLRIAQETGGQLPAGYHPDRVKLAMQGYEQAVKNGKVHKIPHETQATR